jgi:alpha-amylase/alpha-mannosidase (GH57 family)
VSNSLELVLLWHMHQPDYRDPETGEFLFPWVYLHAIKDYSDMAAHLERHRSIRATVNLVPVLLDQLEDYADQFVSGVPRDPLLRLLIHPDPDSMSGAERDIVLDSCFRNNHARMIEPFPAYRLLHQLYTEAGQAGDAGYAYLSGRYLADLLTWYHLAWTGESVRREHALVVQLMTKGAGFNIDERKALFTLIGEIIKSIIPRYRELASDGRIELSTTPHQHPLAPLLLDLRSAREAQSDAALPRERVYPGGRSRVAAHIAHAIESHAARFGSAPRGWWPAEGAISSELMRVLAEAGCTSAASGEAVLVNSLRNAGKTIGDKLQYLYRPYVVEGVNVLFRDDRLSDLIGFEYAKWHGKDAALHFVGELETVARSANGAEVPRVGVMLDGENAWEYYPYNGFYFLQDLYTSLESHPLIRTVTLSSAYAGKAESMDRVVAGSWVYGNFATWIGSPDKNRAWDLLCAAKRSFDLVVASGRLESHAIERARRRLAVCEASDWFWWFGDYNPAHAVASFDSLFRRNLTALYHALSLEAPRELAEPVSHGGGDPEAGGAMRRAS